MLAHGFLSPRALTRAGLVLFAFVGATAPGCQKMPLVAPSGTALSLLASTNVLPINGSTDITAVLIEGVLAGGTTTSVTAGGGTPVHNGTLVTFTTTLGRLEPAEAKTTDGRATVRLVADGRSGTATITAHSGAATETLDVAIGAAAASRITLTASPQTLSGTGGTTTISARVEDEQGNGLSGVPVSFSATRGNLSATSAVSNAQGLATTTLTTSQASTVTANAGASTGTIEIALKPRSTVSITAPTSATVGVPAALVITPAADAVLTKVDVDFGDGTSAQLGAITAATTISHPFRFTGVATVTVRATDSEGEVGTTSTQVAVAPLAVTLTATPVSATLPQVGTVVTLTAVVTPSTAIIDRYEWNFGDGTTATTSGNQVPKTYAAAGTQIISVRVIPFGNGTFATALTTVEVKP